MNILVPKAGDSLYTTVTASAQPFAVMTAKRYVFTSTTGCYIKQGPAGQTPTASGAAGSMYVPADAFVFIDPHFGDTLSVIRVTADGTATLQAITEVGSC